MACKKAYEVTILTTEATRMIHYIFFLQNFSLVSQALAARNYQPSLFKTFILITISLLLHLCFSFFIVFVSIDHRHLFHSKNICPLLSVPYFKVNISCPLPLPHFASLFFAYLWSFRWPNYIVTLPRYFSFRLPHLNINTGPPSD